MPVSKARKTATTRRKPGVTPSKTPIKVAATQRSVQPVELGGVAYEAFCPKRSKFMRVFQPEQIAKLMQLDDEDAEVQAESHRYTTWMLKLVFGPEVGEQIWERLRSDDPDEDLDEDVLGEVLMHLAVIWAPDLANNAMAMKERMEPLTEKMTSMAEEMRARHGSEGG